MHAIERDAAAVILRALRGLGQLLSPTEWAMAVVHGAPPSEVWRLIGERVRALHADLTHTLTRGALIEAAFETPVTETTAGELAAKQIGDLIRGIETQALFAVRAQLAAIADVGITDGALRAIGQATGLTARQLQQVTNAYRASLDAGLAAGLDQQRASEIAGRTASAVRDRALDYRARSIASTETVRLVNDIVHDRGTQIAAAGGQVMHQWVSARDAHVDSGNPLGPCRRNDNGEKLPLHQAFPSGHTSPPAHPFCVVGATRVQAIGRLEAVMERRYEGPVIRIRTHRGHELTCTPNHPVLTYRGWVAAERLHVGEQLPSSIGREWTQSFDPHGEHVPARAEELAEALQALAHRVPVLMPVAAEDFHGDGIGSDVAVVRPNGLLRDAGDAVTSQPRHQPTFVAAGVGQATLPRESRRFPLRPRSQPALRGAVCGHDLMSALGRGHSSPLQSFGLASATDCDPSLEKPLADEDARNPQGARETQFRFSGAVARDEVGKLAPTSGPGQKVGRGATSEKAPPGQFPPQAIEVDPVLKAQFREPGPGSIVTDCVTELRVLGFAGHVFNLQTSAGRFMAAGLIVHNCRCLEEIWVGEPEGATA